MWVFPGLLRTRHRARRHLSYTSSPPPPTSPTPCHRRILGRGGARRISHPAHSAAPRASPQPRLPGHDGSNEPVAHGLRQHRGGVAARCTGLARKALRPLRLLKLPHAPVEEQSPAQEKARMPASKRFLEASPVPTLVVVPHARGIEGRLPQLKGPLSIRGKGAPKRRPRREGPAASPGKADPPTGPLPARRRHAEGLGRSHLRGPAAPTGCFGTVPWASTRTLGWVVGDRGVRSPLYPGNGAQPAAVRNRPPGRCTRVLCPLTSSKEVYAENRTAEGGSEASRGDRGVTVAPNFLTSSSSVFSDSLATRTGTRRDPGSKGGAYPSDGAEAEGYD